jgi:hypothetical protein
MTVDPSISLTGSRCLLRKARARGRQLCLTFRQLRERELREALLSQWQQSMSAPDWCAHTATAIWAVRMMSRARVCSFAWISLPCEAGTRRWAQGGRGLRVATDVLAEHEAQPA